jgi:hypothetical protein
MKYEVGLYRLVTHRRTLFVEAESNDAAYEYVTENIESIAVNGEDTGWRHERTELRVSYARADLRRRPPIDSCNKGASVDAEGEASRGGAAGELGQLPGFA